MHAELLRIFEDDDTLEYKSFQKARSFGDIIFSVNRGKVLNRSVWRRVSQRCSKNDQPACKVEKVETFGSDSAFVVYFGL